MPADICVRGLTRWQWCGVLGVDTQRRPSSERRRTYKYSSMCKKSPATLVEAAPPFSCNIVVRTPQLAPDGEIRNYCTVKTGCVCPCFVTVWDIVGQLYLYSRGCLLVVPTHRSGCRGVDTAVLLHNNILLHFNNIKVRVCVYSAMF